jgi:hypothetical protein
MSSGGWIKLHRKLLKNGWFQTPKLLSFWIWCLVNAAHEDRTEWVGSQKVELNRGEFVFSLKKAAWENSSSVQKIRTMAASLKLRQNITIKSTNKYSIIHIVKWDTYQGVLSEINNQNDLESTSNQHAINTPLIKKEVKEVKKERKLPSPKPSASDPDFDKFWSAYPRKDDKKGAMKAWAKCNGNRPAIDVIVAKVEAFKKSDQWTRDSGQFIPMPTTFINRERWNDEGATVKPYEFKLNLRRNENESR